MPRSWRFLFLIHQQQIHQAEIHGREWNEPIDIQRYIGNGACCIVSPDGKYVFIDDCWASAEFIEELRPKQ